MKSKSNLSVSRRRDDDPEEGKVEDKRPPPIMRKSSLGLKKPSFAKDEDSQKPPIEKTDSSTSLSKSSRRPSVQPRQSSKQVSQDTPDKQRLQHVSEDEENVPAHKLTEENRDLKAILSEAQCGDLTILIANITERMRSSIERAFDATSGLILLKSHAKNDDPFTDADYDPGSVDVGAYDKERKLQEEQEKELAKPQTKKLKKDALKWFDDWRQVVIQRVGQVVNSEETASEQKEKVPAGGDTHRPAEDESRTQKINAKGTSGEYAPPKLGNLFPRVRTPLTKLPLAQRALVLHSIFLLLLSLEHYNAASRVLLLYLTSSLKLGLNSLRQDEEQTAQGLLQAAKQMTAEQEAGKKKAESQESRKWKIRLASAAGAAIIGYTGGMAAPMVAAGVGSVMGELGLGATTAASYLGAVAGNTAIVGSLFGAYGGRMTGQIMSNVSAEVEDFAFLPVHGERKEHSESLDAATDKRRLRVIIAVSGWLLEKEEVVSPWHVLKPSAEVFALRFELEALMNLGQSFDTMLSSAAYGYAQSALAKRTVFSELMSAMWPMALVKVARVVDNPFSVAKARAEKAGEVLAEALMNRAQGERPVTLIGYSLGARVIWSCLTTLAKKRGFGFVESAVMMGSPIPSDITTWRAIRSVVSGRLVNVYSENDYLLAFLYRSASLQYGVAGLMPVTGLAGIENVDVSEIVSGHLRYRYLVGSILDKIRLEDVDKGEVKKESQAFEAIVEEEKKNTYEKQLKEHAGNLYDQYGGSIGLPKGGRKLLPQKEKELTDDKANREASKMEKEVQQKTQKGLMQWAVEQLYISRPEAPSTADAKSAATNPQGAYDKSRKQAKETTDAAIKSLYQRASEAMYLTRSGGAEGEAAAKDKTAKAQAGASKGSSSYLSSAKGYLPSFGSSPRKPKAAGEVSKRPSTLGKSKSKSRGSTPTIQKVKDAKDDAANSAETPAKQASEKAKGDTEDVKQAAGKASEKAKESTTSYSNYLPSFGMGRSAPRGKEEASKEPPETPPNKSEIESSNEKPDDKEARSDDKKETPDQKNESNEGAEQSKGYGSYIPSFGLGGSKPANDQQQRQKGQEQPPKRDGGLPETPESSQADSGYGSYIPSLGLGKSSDTKTEKSDPETKTDTRAEDESSGQASKTSETQSGPEGEQRKAEPDETENDNSQNHAEDHSRGGDETPKNKYPWESYLQQRGKENDKPAKEGSSSYSSYVPSFGFGGSSDGKKGGDEAGEEASQPFAKLQEAIAKRGESGGGDGSAAPQDAQKQEKEVQE